jgi:tRNA-specific 2-thiouridylase
MSNWEDDGYCDSAREFQDARRICQQLGLPLHRVNFAREYREQVFADFLEEHRRGRTPNPDVLCNREIKFGVMRRYAERLGATQIATGHYARIAVGDNGEPQLRKARDSSKDQSYFLHAVAVDDLRNVLFPLGDLLKAEVRELARKAGLAVAEKKDSTGICFIGERPFAEFLHAYLPDTPGVIRDDRGQERGHHRGLAYYTLGQRHGLAIGGTTDGGDAPWYVAGKNFERNEVLVVQGQDHPLLFQNWLLATELRWLGTPPAVLAQGQALRCTAKIRYRQTDQACTVTVAGAGQVEVKFDQPQRTPAPGQYVVFYDGERCLGGATIARAEQHDSALRAVS